jgi:two-component sensor histidine kinase
MEQSRDDATPVVEPGSPDKPDLSRRALQQRIRQQEILASLGVTALHGASFDELLDSTARMAAEALHAEFSKVLEYMPAEGRFLVRAGVGWQPGVVGVATVGADLASPAGYALRTGKPVISNHLENEERFRTPEILRQHGVHRAMNVILQGEGRPFGVLEVDSRSDDEFIEHDLAFLQGAANLLGMAIERERQERDLKAALERHEVLLKEMNHRVKNSLAIVSSMLQLQASEVDDAAVTQHLSEAAQRVMAVAKAHDQLSHGTDVERMDIGRYISTVCRDLDDSVPHCVIRTDAQAGIEIATDRAIATALVVNELIANAVKHSPAGRPDCQIRVKVSAGAGQDTLVISVRDEGAGLPSDFDLARPKGLGMRIVMAFVGQLHGTLAAEVHRPGTEFVLTIPRRPPA